MPYVEKHSEEEKREEKRGNQDISWKMLLLAVASSIGAMLGYLAFINYGTMYGLRENEFSVIWILIIVAGALLILKSKKWSWRIVVLSILTSITIIQL